MSTFFDPFLTLMGPRDNPSPSAPPLNQSLINEFINLSRSREPVDIGDRLRVFRDTNANISSLKSNSPTRNEVSNAAVPLLCKPDASASVQLAPKSSDRPHPYVRLVDRNQPITVTPECAAVFERLVKATDKVNHPAGLSSLTFAFASLISLCTSCPDRQDLRYNKVPGLLDLSPLYGLTDADTIHVRAYTEGRGLLCPDAFFEPGDRLLFVPRATSVLLVLLSRNHNYIARRLLEENEDGKWVPDPTTLGDSDVRKTQDEEIFQLARRINCGTFRNIVANDFLKGLLGFGTHEYSPAIDLFSDVKPQELERYRVSVESTLLYDWNSLLSQADVQHIESVLEEHINNDFNDITPDQLNKAFDGFLGRADMNREQRSCVGLKRDDRTKRFHDAELADVLHSAAEAPAAACRPHGAEVCVRVLELATMECARAWSVCSLNQFRELLGLPVYISFAEWASTSEVAYAAQELYEDINELELYAGLRGEKTVDGAGFCLGKTTTQGLIADIVRLIRSDPKFSKDFTPVSLTRWGYAELTPNPNNGAFGACLPKLLLRNLPNNYTYNSVYSLFPFMTPDACRGTLPGAAACNGVDYVFGRPVPRLVKTVDTLDAIRVVLGDPVRFSSPYGVDLQRLTGGYGYLLGFDDKEAHDRDEWLTLTSLIPDAGALGRYADFYRETAERLIKERSTRVDDTRCQVDVVQDVINAVSACWAAERICGIPLDTTRGYTTKEVFQMLLDLNNCIFGNAEPQDYLILCSNAANAAKTITGCIERNLELVGVDAEAQSLVSRLRSLFNEVYKDEPPESNDSHDFLARLHASGRDTKELSANALGLAVLSSVGYAQTCAAAVRFYLNDARAIERKSLRALAQGGSEVNQKIMGYIREAQRLDPQIPVLYRDVTIDHLLQVAGADQQEFKQGDRVCADFKKAHAVPADIDPDRHTRFLQGAGFHRCIGIPFVEKTMPEVFKAIFRLEDIRSESGKGGFQSFFVSYEKLKASSQGEKDKPSHRSVPFIQRACDLILIVVAVAVLYWITIGLGGFFSNLRGRTLCPNAGHIRPWQAYTMLPGPDNKTVPFIFSVHDARPRKLSFVDIDERDMRFKVLVDGKLKQVSTDFELNKSVYCGQNLHQCIEQGFSKSSVVVPPGKHTVKVEWMGKDFVPGTNLIDWGGNRTRRFMWKQESC